MMDANFCLKLKDRGVDDVYLSSGWAYMVEDSKFKQFLDVYAQDKIEVIQSFETLVNRFHVMTFS